MAAFIWHGSETLNFVLDSFWYGISLIEVFLLSNLLESVHPKSFFIVQRVIGVIQLNRVHHRQTSKPILVNHVSNKCTLIEVGRVFSSLAFIKIIVFCLFMSMQRVNQAFCFLHRNCVLGLSIDFCLLAFTQNKG